MAAAPQSDLANRDPLALFGQWMREAEASEPNDPNAMALATVGEDGIPSVRIVLLKAYDANGFAFFTNLGSRKGQDLSRHPFAALAFYWKSLRRQIRIEGSVHPVSEAEADAYFASRPRESQIGAWASRQSEALLSADTLRAAFTAAQSRFSDASVPRPPFWSGFRVVPTRIEFWRDQPHRLHERIEFFRAAPDAPWASRRLFP